MPPPPRVLLLAMHGAPPSDFPPDELQEFFRLHAALEHAPDPNATMRARHTDLERRLRAWPRTRDNDPFHAASLALGEALQRRTGDPAIVAFNEFCDPDLDAGLRQAAALAGEQVVVVTPMLTPGGEHAERDIPRAIERARRESPRVSFRYAWPIPLEATAGFLADHISRAEPGDEGP